MEAVGQLPRGLTVKQIARRCELTVATTYHLVRTLAYEGYVIRREDGTYVVGLEVADRYKELVVAFRGSPGVGEVLRKAAAESGYTHCLAAFVNQRIAVTAVAEGVRSPHMDELLVGFDEAAHATAAGKALLATMTADQRWRYLKEHGMSGYTPATVTSPEALDAELAGGERRGMQLEIGQYRLGVASAAVLVRNDRDPDQRLVLACTAPAPDLMSSPKAVRSRLVATAKELVTAFDEAPI